MNSLVTQSTQLPDTLDDLSRFVLIGRERLSAMKAEIRAINKLNLAKEVWEQKFEESQMLSGLLLDAEARVGELTPKIPTAQGKRTDKKELRFSGETKLEQKPKEQVISELGFSKKQVHQFETLAKNRDLIEQVKQESKENGDIPTRTRVLDLARERDRRQSQNNDFSEYIHKCRKLADRYHNAVVEITRLAADLDDFKQLSEIIPETTRESNLRRCDDAMAKLSRIRQFFKEGRLQK